LYDDARRPKTKLRDHHIRLFGHFPQKQGHEGRIFEFDTEVAEVKFWRWMPEWIEHNGKKIYEAVR
jgi:hypothetical protein